MYEPLTKTVAGPIKRHVIIAARDREFRRLVQYPRLRGEEVSPKREKEILQSLNEQTSNALKLLAQEEPEGIEVANFLQSGVDALKALVPWPGFADDVKTFGEISSNSYERIVGRDAPWYYTPLGDIALQTVAITGLLKMANSANTAKNARDFALGAKLTKAELKAIHFLACVPKTSLRC